MYNGIGLQTPRGSGTSGYVVANLSKPKKKHSRLDFLKELKELRENQLEAPRAANPEILDHNNKRQIYVRLAELKKDLEKQQRDPKEIEIILKELELKLWR